MSGKRRSHRWVSRLWPGVAAIAQALGLAGCRHFSLHLGSGGHHRQYRYRRGDTLKRPYQAASTPPACPHHRAVGWETCRIFRFFPAVALRY